MREDGGGLPARADAIAPGAPRLRVRRLSTQETRRLAEVGVLSASLVHELRQPLFAARAMAQLAQAAARPEQVAGHLDGVLAQLQTLDALLRGYSELSRRPAGEAVPFDVWTAIRAALVILEHRARAGGVSLELVGEKAVMVRAPVLAVQQVIVNLGQNAIDALLRRPDARLQISVLAGPVRVRVQDNGPGLEPAIRARLFEPFRTTKAEGTGLGLMLSRDLAASFGGTLALVETPAGTGTTWEIGIPG